MAPSVCAIPAVNPTSGMQQTIRAALNDCQARAPASGHPGWPAFAAVVVLNTQKRGACRAPFLCPDYATCLSFFR
ncbi:protein of unknown function [Trichlorobacter ammonificans]|uniref:Uncharacterized protein n=1 Tax=Trichlorobacter ammonificans TaxID=2916410 RepID=A0ABM9D8U5_9BACT|nr:protein of unknown function [Trichlorobacter ammonificans]